MRGRLISTGIQRFKYVASDYVMSAAAFIVFNIYRYFAFHIEVYGVSLFQYLSSPKLILEECLIPVVLLGLYWLSGYYNKPFDRSRLQEFVTTLFSAIISTLMIFIALLINDTVSEHYLNYKILATLFLLMLLFTYTSRYAITQTAINRFSARRWCINTVIIGNSKAARLSAYSLARSDSRLGYNIMAFVNIPGERQVNDGQRVLDFDELGEFCRRTKADQLLLVPEIRDDKRVLSLLDRLFHLGIPIKIAPDTLSFVTSGIRLQDIYGEPFVDLSSPACSESSKNVKRLLDVVISAMVLTVFSPLYLLIAILVKRSSPGPVIYSQERIGYRQKPFMIYKFRSMRVDAETEGPKLSSEADSRVTPWGRTMRKYRLDELPQFWNVLKGDMSLVGPRPEREFFIRQIVERAPYYTLLQQVHPGITGWGMVKYGYASTIEQMIERLRFDLIYISNMSTLVDLKILIYTVKTVVTGRGV